MDLLENATLPFGVAQQRKKCLKSTAVFGIFCHYSASPGPHPEGGCDGVGGDEKLTVGRSGKNQTFSAIGQTFITSHLNY